MRISTTGDTSGKLSHFFCDKKLHSNLLKSRHKSKKKSQNYKNVIQVMTERHFRIKHNHNLITKIIPNRFENPRGTSLSSRKETES